MPALTLGAAFQVTRKLTLTADVKTSTGGDDAITEEVLDLFTQQAAMWSPLLDVRDDGWRQVWFQTCWVDSWPFPWCFSFALCQPR